MLFFRQMTFPPLRSRRISQFLGSSNFVHMMQYTIATTRRQPVHRRIIAVRFSLTIYSRAMMISAWQRWWTARFTWLRWDGDRVGVMTCLELMEWCIIFCYLVLWHFVASVPRGGWLVCTFDVFLCIAARSRLVLAIKMISVRIY